jgi:hypothetical protein
VKSSTKDVEQTIFCASSEESIGNNLAQQHSISIYAQSTQHDPTYMCISDRIRFRNLHFNVGNILVWEFGEQHLLARDASVKIGGIGS